MLPDVTLSIKSARVVVENFGTFEHAEIELKPLTIFVGRNSVGKSVLLYLLWTQCYLRPYLRECSR